MSDQDDFILRPPFNVVRELSVRLGTLDTGIRATILEIRFDPIPEEPRREVTFLLDDDLASMLRARLLELSERDPPAKH